MKKYFFVPMLVCGFVVSAQTKTSTKTTAPAPVLKNLNDSASYAIGLSVANFYSQQGITNLNASVISKAINDVLTKKKILLNDQQANMAITKCMTEAQQKKSKPNIQASEKFLAANKTRQGVKTTASGLQYEVIQEGTGVKPTENDSVTVHYKGTLINGTEFDNSFKRGAPITFVLSQVIRGWTEGLQLMSVGSKYKFYIPYQLGYGTQDMGAIPPGSTLIFEVELLDVPGKK